MTDIHSHLLHGLDDGSQSLASSLAMLEAAAADGIRTIIATPHYSSGIAERMQEKIAELRPEAEKSGIGLFSGCEYSLSKLTLQDGLLTLGKSNYLLVDFGFLPLSPMTRSFMFQWQSRGYRIVLAHPERLFTRNDLPVLKDLAAGDVYFQLNAGSFRGDYGWGVRRFAKILLKQRLCHIIASDAHSVKAYSGQLPACRKYVGKCLGTAAAAIFFETNPERLLAGKALLSVS